MAKSKIIKELANSSIDTATALKRLKILLLNLNKPELNNWVNSELNGYKNADDVPEYRRFRGKVTIKTLHCLLRICRMKFKIL